jgi:hypothetical protein
MPETPEIPEELPLAEVTAANAEAMASANQCETPETAHVSGPAKENAPMLDINDASETLTDIRDAQVIQQVAAGFNPEFGDERSPNPDAGKPVPQKP